MVEYILIEVWKIGNGPTVFFPKAALKKNLEFGRATSF